MTEEEIIERLTWIAGAKLGEPLPEWMGGPTNNWGPPLSELAKQTLNLIEDLAQRNEEEKNAKFRRICIILLGSLLSGQITTLLLMSEQITNPELKSAVKETLDKLQKQADHLWQGMNLKPPDQNLQ